MREGSFKKYLASYEQHGLHPYLATALFSVAQQHSVNNPMFEIDIECHYSGLTILSSSAKVVVIIGW